MNHEAIEAWMEALETAKAEQPHHSIEINSPVITRWDGKRGYYNRWGVFCPAAV